MSKTAIRAAQAAAAQSSSDVAPQPGPAARMTLQDVPEYVEAANKLAELQGRTAELANRQASLQVEWDNLAESNPQFRSLAGMSTRNADRHAKALALLSGEDTNSARSRFTEIQAELRKIEEDLEVVRHAITLQEPVFDRARTKASLQVCRALFPEHQSLAQRFSDAADNFFAAYEELREFARWMECEDIRAMRPIDASGIAGLSADNPQFATLVGGWRQRLRQSGYDFNVRAARTSG